MTRCVCFVNHREAPVPVPPNEKQLMEIFRQLDVNGDGVLSKEELKLAFKKWGAWFPGMPNRRANGGLDYADSNHDGCIDKGEFGDLVTYALGRGYTVK